MVTDYKLIGSKIVTVELTLIEKSLFGTIRLIVKKAIRMLVLKKLDREMEILHSLKVISKNMYNTKESVNHRETCNTNLNPRMKRVHTTNNRHCTLAKDAAEKQHFRYCVQNA